MSYQNYRRRDAGRASSRGAYAPRKSSPNNRRNSSKKSKKANGDSIHYSRYIKSAKPTVTAEIYAPTYTFDDFAIDARLRRNIAAKGIVTPSPIQDQAIPAALAGNDIIGIANTGTGKTLAFSAPVIHRLLTEPGAKALVLAPTRELAEQIEAEMKSVGKGSGLFGATLIGGVNMRPQFMALADNPEIIIGTPGRVKDHLQRGTLDLSSFNMVVLDEFDRMLDMGFVNDVRMIVARLSRDKQSLLFSATLDNKIKALVTEFTQDPVTIQVKSGETTDTVEQDVIFYQTKDEKIELLHDLLIDDATKKVLIFHETKYGADRLGQTLVDRGFAAGSIHGGKTQGARSRTLREFKSNTTNVLVATDVAARGIDVPDITHVINYAEPQTYADYVHRIGRAGRAGKMGFAVTFVEKTARN